MGRVPDPPTPSPTPDRSELHDEARPPEAQGQADEPGPSQVVAPPDVPSEAVSEGSSDPDGVVSPAAVAGPDGLIQTFSPSAATSPEAPPSEEQPIEALPAEAPGPAPSTGSPPDPLVAAQTAGEQAGPTPETDLDGSGDGEESEDDEGDELHERRGGLLTKEVHISARALLGVGGVIVLAALVIGAYVLGQRQGDKLTPADPSKPTSTTAFKLPQDYATFADPDTGVKLSFPKDWTQRSTADLPDKSLRLLAGIPNTADSVSLRVNSYESEITAANLNDQKNVFDEVIAAEDRKVLVDQAMNLRGLPALFYVYKFTDQSTGQAGIHAHFFVFQGRKMVSMVFQAVPEARYSLLAPVFDKIASSLEIAPGPPPAFLEPVGKTTTTVAGGSTTTTPGGSTTSTSPPSTPTSAPPTT